MKKKHTQEELDQMTETFGLLFLLSRRWRRLVDLELASSGLTTKQWMILAIIEQRFDSPPSIKEVARKFGTPHQNIKTIALKLEKMGFIKIKGDKHDRRMLRLETTKKNDDFWKKRQAHDVRFISTLFQKLSKEKVSEFHKALELLIQDSERRLEKKSKLL